MPTRSLRILRRRASLLIAPIIVLCITGGIKGWGARKNALRELQHSYELSGYELDTALTIMSSDKIFENTERSLEDKKIKLRRGELRKQFRLKKAGEMTLLAVFRHKDALTAERVIAQFMMEAERSLRQTLSAPKKNKQNELATYVYQLAEADASKSALTNELKELLSKHPMNELPGGKYSSRLRESLGALEQSLTSETAKNNALRLELITIEKTILSSPEVMTQSDFLPQLTALNKTIREIDTRLQDLRKTMTDAHPRVAKVIKEREAARSELMLIEAKASAAPKLEDTLRGKLKSRGAKKRTELTLSSTRLKAFAAEVEAQKKSIGHSARSAENEAEQLGGRITSLNERTARLLLRKNAASEALSEIMSRNVKLSMVGKPTVKIIGGSFSLSMFLALGAGLGFLLGVLLVAIAEKSDPMLDEDDDLKVATGMELLAEIALPKVWPVRQSGALRAGIISVVVFALLTGAILVFVYPGWESIRASFAPTQIPQLTEEIR